jgi:hypothetical protein
MPIAVLDDSTREFEGYYIYSHALFFGRRPTATRTFITRSARQREKEIGHFLEEFLDGEELFACSHYIHDRNNFLRQFLRGNEKRIITEKNRLTFLPQVQRLHVLADDAAYGASLKFLHAFQEFYPLLKGKIPESQIFADKYTLAMEQVGPSFSFGQPVDCGVTCATRADILLSLQDIAEGIKFAEHNPAVMEQQYAMCVYHDTLQNSCRLGSSRPLSCRKHIKKEQALNGR